MADGSAIDPEGMYTVAAWNGSVNPERITSVEVSYDEPAEELFREYVTARGSIRPELDREFVLKWD